MCAEVQRVYRAITPRAKQRATEGVCEICADILLSCVNGLFYVTAVVLFSKLIYYHDAALLTHTRLLIIQGRPYLRLVAALRPEKPTSEQRIPRLS